MKLLTKKMILGLALATTVFLGGAASSYAYPTLQLDISADSHYDYATQSIVTSNFRYTVNAYLLSGTYNTIDDTYYVSFSLSDTDGTDGVADMGIVDLGDFSVNGTTTAVTAGMTYGVAPIDGIIDSEGWGDPSLPAHGLWPSYFLEVGFSFDAAQYINPYNTQDRAIAGSAIDYTYVEDPNKPNLKMYYQTFSVDISSLNSLYGMHTDLYNVNIKDKNKRFQTQFAPFSHDVSAVRVPEPDSLLLVGLGLLTVWGFRRRLMAAKELKTGRSL